MPTIIQTAHDRLVREVADRYMRQGYYVKVEPADTELPEFLQGYHPDLIVTTPDGAIVVEVKTTGKVRHLDYWEGLKNAVEAQTGWRFQLILDSRREEELIGAEQPLLSRSEMEARLLATEQLADKGLLDSALLVIWSIIEGVLREESRKQGIKLPNQGPASLITALYAQGNLGRPEYDALMVILEVRNQVAHGFQADNMNRSLLDQAETTARRLMKQHGLDG